MKIENQEVWKSNFQKYENHTSRNMISEIQEVPKSYSNDNNVNNNKYNTDFNKTITSYPIISELPDVSEPDREVTMDDLIGEYECCRELVKNNSEYDYLLQSCRKEWLDEIVEIMVDVICSREPYIRINKQDYPYEMVKDSVSVLNCMKVQLLGY